MAPQNQIATACFNVILALLRGTGGAGPLARVLNRVRNGWRVPMGLSYPTAISTLSALDPAMLRLARAY
jgi:hypothetical protein